MANKRVVITGLGVVAPNGIGLTNFHAALSNGLSGIRFFPELQELGFSCCVAGKPAFTKEYAAQFMSELELKSGFDNGLVYGTIAGLMAWENAGFKASASQINWDAGTIFGNGNSGSEKFRESVYQIDLKQTRKLGSTAVIQTMVSGISALLAGKLGLGNQISTNSSACSTGTESLIMCYERIRSGAASVMLSGSTSDSGPYIWGGFDAMKVCNYKSNEHPDRASRPMSATAGGMIPSSGAAALVVESLDSAIKRKAHIYAEIKGGHINSGGQRGGGSMTAPNNEGVQRCIRSAIESAELSATDIDLINAHLTATGKDATEIENWCEALNRRGLSFPYIQAIKSTVGHCLSASGSIELVAAALQLKHQLLYPNMNCEDLHPEISSLIAEEKIPRALQKAEINVVAKASFGFGDVNSCVILKKFDQ